MRSFLLAGVAGALCLGGVFAQPSPVRADAFISISVGFAPPPLPVYEQAPIPGPDYLWAPGYWAWDGDFGDYYWVPGTWVQAPTPGYLWTPGYWGWNDGAFAWNAGYWGPQVGYYGGVNYGFGYTGGGYEGGYWNGDHFFYNRAVNNISNVSITNVYTKTVVVNETAASRISYNGGTGGVTAKPTPEQAAIARQPHVAATALQTQNEHAASGNPALFASKNHGLPPVAATAHPGVFSGAEVVAPKSGPATPYVLSATHGAKVPATPEAAAAAHPQAAAAPAVAKPAEAAKADAVAGNSLTVKPRDTTVDARPAHDMAAPPSAMSSAKPVSAVAPAAAAPPNPRTADKEHVASKAIDAGSPPPKAEHAPPPPKPNSPPPDKAPPKPDDKTPDN